MKAVYVKATRNLDFLNEGQVVKMDRDPQVERLLKAGYLEEVPAASVSEPEVEEVDAHEELATDVAKEAVPARGEKAAEPATRATRAR